MSRPYAIMLGQKKTGTTSFRHALDIAYRHIPGATANRDIRNRCKQLYSAGKYDKFIELTNRWNVVKDNPWNQGDMYKKLAEAYPKALFYLNIRDPDSWYRSKLGFGSESYDPNDPNKKHIDPTAQYMQRMQYYARNYNIKDFRDADSAKQAYVNRNEEIQSYFAQYPSIQFYRIDNSKEMNWSTIQRTTQIDEAVLRENILEWQNFVKVKNNTKPKGRGTGMLVGYHTVQTFIENKDDDITRWVFPRLNVRSKTGVNPYDFKYAGWTEAETRSD